MMLYNELFQEKVTCLKAARKMADTVVNFGPSMNCCHKEREKPKTFNRLKPINEEKVLIDNQITHMRRKKVRCHIRKFFEDSTCHGFHFVGDGEYRIRQLIWLIIVVSSMGFLAQKLHEGATKYFEYPFTTTSTLSYENEMEYPAVSICNLNNFRKSKMQGRKLHDVFGQLAANKSLPSNYLVQSVSAEEYRNATEESHHTIEDMLKSCKFGLSQMCNASNFTWFYQTQGEKCFTIHPNMTLKETGPGNGLQLIIDVQHYEYYDSKTDGAGIRLIIHNQNETPIRNQGITLSPGFKTFVALQMTKTQNLPAPYITNCGSVKLDYFKNGYSQDLCWVEKLTKYVVENCTCKDSFMPGDAEVCSLAELRACTWPRWEEFKNMYKISDICPLACEKTTFYPLLSFARFPSNVYAEELAKELNLTGEKQENWMFLRDNYLQVMVYFDELNYIMMEQKPSYDTMVMLGDLGGKLGLFLGTSILTYLEFFDCLAMVIYTKYFEIFRVRRK